MALIVDHQQGQHKVQPQFKHYCRICNKGFGCNRALGGHMRAHGITYDSTHMDEDEDYHTSDWEDGNIIANDNKRMYALRTNPSRLKSCRVCENCGKEFSSWKSFLEHGKCTSDDVESLVSSHSSDDVEEDLPKRRYGHNWTKRKRSSRAKVGGIINPFCPSTEEEDLAHCLMMLSNGTVSPFFVTEPEESCASASRDEEQRYSVNFMTSNNPHGHGHNILNAYEKAKVSSPKGLFECKACKKVFNSHQALGGHRASHKKVKGCFAAKIDHTYDNIGDDDQGIIIQDECFQTKSRSAFQFDHGGSSSKKKAKIHECSICHRVFSSGQALGGHKRCHWITSNNSLDHTSGLFTKFGNNQCHDYEGAIPRNLLKKSNALDLTLDLNFPAPLDGNKSKPNHQVSRDIFLLPWLGGDGDQKDKSNTSEDTSKIIQDDETEREGKFARLSELKDMNTSENSSQWLQVGIGSVSSKLGGDSS